MEGEKGRELYLLSSVPPPQVSRTSLVYSLYGVVVHSGGMQDGHYTAYVKTRSVPTSTPQATPIPTSQATPIPQTTPTASDLAGTDPAAPHETATCNESQAKTKTTDSSSVKEQWYYTSDSHIRTVTEAEALKSQAYLLFYERLCTT